MSETTRSETARLPLDQLIALNDEIIALSRSGVPLGRGLIDIGYDLPGRLGRFAVEIGQRLEAGESLPAAFDQHSALPPAYRALVVAGVRSGHLPAALEGVSSLIRQAVETRRYVALAFIYPLLVLSLAYALILITLVKMVPIVSAAYHDFLGDTTSLAVLDGLAQHAVVWWPVFPAICLVLAAAAWRSMSTRYSVAGLYQNWNSRWNILAAGRVAIFADTLALLIEHDVPLEEALPMAAQVSRQRRLLASAERWSEQLRRGETMSQTANLDGAPPILGWLLTQRLDQCRLVDGLRRVGASYHQRVAWNGRWISVYLPIWLTVFIGGTATILYATLVIGPWAHLLHQLSFPL